jgi:hypothetical protein
VEIVKSDPQQGGTLVSAFVALVNAYTSKPENQLIAAEVDILGSNDNGLGGSYFDIGLRPPSVADPVFVYCALKAGSSANASDPAVADLSLSAVVKKLYTRAKVTAAFGTVTLNNQFETPCARCQVGQCPAVLKAQFETTTTTTQNRGLQTTPAGGQASSGKGSGSNNTGLIVGICVVLVVCIALVAAFVVRRRFNQMSKTPGGMASGKNTREGTVAFENPLCTLCSSRARQSTT